MTRFAAATRVAAVLALVTALAGCREEEQDRILNFEKGVYQGAEDQDLTPEARDALGDRVLKQGRF